MKGLLIATLLLTFVATLYRDDGSIDRLNRQLRISTGQVFVQISAIQP